MDAAFGEHIGSVVAKCESLLQMEPVSLNPLPASVPSGGGVYIFSDGASHLYVGRTRRLRHRLLEHARLSATDAPFAFRLARRAIGCEKPTYQKSGGRKELLASPDFRKALADAKGQIRLMDVRYVSETDPVCQALLELYAAVVTGAPFNEFQTT